MASNRAEKFITGDSLAWLPWYPRDVLTDERVASMGLEAEGALRRLLDYEWINGSIPDGAVIGELTEIRRILGNISAQRTRKIWKQVEPFFPETCKIDGRRRRQNRKLERIRNTQSEKHLAYVARAKRASRKRWDKAARSNAPSNAPSNASSSASSNAHAMPTDQSTDLLGENSPPVRLSRVPERGGALEAPADSELQQPTEADRARRDRVLAELSPESGRKSA